MSQPPDDGRSIGSARAAEVCDQLGLPPCRWDFPDVSLADPSGLVVIGGDLDPQTLITAYCEGLFPMPFGRRRRIGWWSPDPRAIIPTSGLQVSRSLRRSRRRFELRVDTAFEETMNRCGDPRRPHGWITPAFIEAYCKLHELGIAHSVECWSPEGQLVGGLYGIGIGSFFAGESMFHTAPDASKVALLGLCALLDPGATGRPVVLDVQWSTPHLRTLGAQELPRDQYLELLGAALNAPQPEFSRDRLDQPWSTQ